MEIVVDEVKPGNVIRHFFVSGLGLHRIEGEVTSISEDSLSGGEKYYAIKMAEARCSDVRLTAPGGKSYLYGDEGLVMRDYGLSIMSGQNVLILADSLTVEPSREILAEVLPVGSRWTWSPGDSSQSAVVTITKSEESSNGPWHEFVDECGSVWALDSDAFESQCSFLDLGPAQVTR